ncbi:MAG TPA: 2-phosphosulfolactate phosphatase [Methanocella sp.]|nr:2-phosphosulfolactate phosphatase [Methanocella sp.]
MRCYVGPEGRDEYLAEPYGVPVIVDVLRASSTIVVALSRGAARVIPVRDYDEALALGRRLGAYSIGERNGIRVEGFTYSNSPTDVLQVPLEGKTIVMVTTNGTQVMVEGGIVASTINAGAVAARIASVPHAYMLASGSPKKSDEDRCAAQLIELIAAGVAAGAAPDAAAASVFLGEGGQRLLDGIRRSRSGEKLTAYGYGADVDLVCTAVNRYPVLPVYHNGEITLAQR